MHLKRQTWFSLLSTLHIHIFAFVDLYECDAQLSKLSRQPPAKGALKQNTNYKSVCRSRSPTSSGPVNLIPMTRRTRQSGISIGKIFRLTKNTYIGDLRNILVQCCTTICLVESHSQDVHSNTGMLSVLPHTF